MKLYRSQADAIDRITATLESSLQAKRSTIRALKVILALLAVIMVTLAVVAWRR